MTGNLLESLSDSLAAFVPGAHLDVSCERVMGDQLKPDTTVKMTVGDRALIFIIETRGDVYPRDAREMVWRLKRYNRNSDPSGHGCVSMIVAESVSDGARAFLREEHVAYYDLSGSLYVHVDDVFILIEKPKPNRTKRREVNVFRGSRSQVLHTLFARPGEWISGTEIAGDAGVSPATVSQTLKNIERRDWLEVRGKGPDKRRRLSRPDALLDAWRDSVLWGPKAKRTRYYAPGMKPEEMVGRIKREMPCTDIDLEFTGQFAAQFHAPFLSNVSNLAVRVRGKRDRETLLSILDAHEVSEGANLIVIDAGSDRLSRDPNDDGEGSLFASPLQVYLDLLEDHGRSKEMAEHLRSRKLVWR